MERVCDQCGNGCGLESKGKVSAGKGVGSAGKCVGFDRKGVSYDAKSLGYEEKGVYEERVCELQYDGMFLAIVH